MSPPSNTTNDIRYNKIRNVGGSYRLTLLIEAVRDASMDRVRQPLTANIPLNYGTWCVFDIDRYESQLLRIQIRKVISNTLPNYTVLGEYPVRLKEKKQSKILSIPRQLYDDIRLANCKRMTSIAIAPGLLVVACEKQIGSLGIDLDNVIAEVRDYVTHEVGISTTDFST